MAKAKAKKDVRDYVYSLDCTLERNFVHEKYLLWCDDPDITLGLCDYEFHEAFGVELKPGQSAKVRISLEVLTLPKKIRT